MLGEIIGGVGGLLGSLFSGGDNGASEAQQNAINAIQSLKIPEIDKALLLNEYQQAGTLTPELIQKINLHADTPLVMKEDPQNRANQQASLNALKQLSQTGMSAQDLAQMQQMRSQVAQDTNAKSNQLLQQSQMRGQLGGGDSLAAQLMSNQMAHQNASKDAVNAAAQAAQARRDALNSYTSLAGNVRNQDTSTQQYNNENERLRQQFLDQNALSRQQSNVSAGNNANLYNLQRQQGVNDQNASIQNQELQRQMDAKAQMYQMQLQKAGMLSGAYNNQSAQMQGQADRSAKNTANIISGAGNVFSGIGKGIQNSNDVNNNPNSTQQQKDQASIWRFSEGGRVPGEAPFSGDSQHNDQIQALLSPEEIVIPRSKAKNPNKAKDYVYNLFEKEQKDKSFDKNEAILDLIAKLHSNKKK